MGGHLIVEGHGEGQAVQNLVVRLWSDLDLAPMNWAGNCIRGKNLMQRDGIERACSIVRASPDVEALLILRDADDENDCPARSGPETARWVAALNLPYPAAVVLLRKEYEVLFLPCLGRMAGRMLGQGNQQRPGLIAGTRYEGDPESKRGVKEWLTDHYPPGRKYRPTTDQLPLTRLIDFGDLRRARLPCFETLERALRFLDENRGQSGVYPPPA